ncbi:MAG: glycosyltransferase family 9 protein [Bacteroidales bacterium]|jgi:ADP-heptose:LPS heptosyltransferase|nr:glycosyltransferase family 9 protein [Bacteroidales bacterium]
MRSTRERVLVIRASAMGDVALAVPLLDELAGRYPDTEFVFLTRKEFNPLVRTRGVSLFNPDFRGRHLGLSGIIRLRADIDREGRIEKVVDLHDVLRSKVLRFLFRLTGRSVSVIDKGRSEKRKLLKGVIRTPLRHVTDRYADTFANAGYPLKGSFRDFRYEVGEEVTLPGAGNGSLKIGIAPFARHKLKAWPVEKIRALVSRINDFCDADFYLFGGGDSENRLLASLAEEIPGAVNMCGRYSLSEEIDMISRLDVMVAMDSANMHVAALTGTRVVSVWGGTHPAAGFGPMGENDEYIAQISWDTLRCRPCTIYGRGECRRGDFACMQWLTDEMVFSKIKAALGQKKDLCRDDN